MELTSDRSQLRYPLFLTDGGEAGSLIRSIDWNKSTLGLMENWPVSLKSTLSLVIHSKHPMFVLWGSDLIQFYNDAYIPSFGIGKHPKAMGQSAYECWPENWHIVGPQIHRVMTTGESTWNQDHLIPIYRNGKVEEVYWTYSFSPIFNDDGTTGGMLAVCSETSDRVIYSREFKLHKQKLEALFYGSASPLVFFRGPDLIYDTYNTKYQELVPKRQLFNRPLLEAIPELEGTQFPKLIKQVYVTGEQIQINEEFAPLQNPLTLKLESRYFDSAISRVNYEDGSPYGVFVQATEVTDRVMARKRMEQALSTRDAFLSIASHELRTPITGMMLQTQLLKREIIRGDVLALSPERIFKLVDQAERSLTRMSHLVDNMLDISVIEADKLSLVKESTEFISLVRNIISLFEIQLKKSNINVKLDEEIPSLYVSVDRFRIEQVLTNLISNAIRYAPNGNVNIRLKSSNNFLIMEFEDHGPGIAPSDRDRIFDRFETILSGLETPGLGLGLCIVKQILEAHGGQIRLDSEYTAGARFIIELPLNA